jgi:hypothetical protein
MSAAVKRGWPRIMVINRKGAAARSVRLVAHFAVKAGMDRDEYPAAIGRGRPDGRLRSLVLGTGPVGWQADFAYVPSNEKRSFDAALKSALRRFCDGTRFRYVFTSSPATKTPAPVVAPAPVKPTPPAVVAPTTPAPTPAPAPQAPLTFTGNGSKTLPPFTLPHGATLQWTNDGALFTIYDGIGDPDVPNPSTPVNSNAASGSTYLPAGTHSFHIIAAGNWTITITPRS